MNNHHFSNHTVGWVEMKKIIQLGICCLMLFGSCKKGKETFTDNNSAVMVINGTVDVAAIQVKQNNNPIVYSTAPKINYGTGAFRYFKAGDNNFKVVNAIDSTKFILDKPVRLNYKLYSLYLIGQSPNLDTLLREEGGFPFVPVDKITTGTDSIINIRFVNLSPNSAPVKINIKGNTNNEVAALAYKGITGFKAYSAKPANVSYIFEVRDAVSGIMLSSYTLNITTTNRFRNVALVIRGLSGTTTGTNAFNVSAINYF